MHFPVFRCNVSTNWLRKLPRPRIPSVHGWSSSRGTPQPLPKTKGCHSNTADIPSRNQSTPSGLCTTYPTLFLLLYGSQVFPKYISCWYWPWTPRERLWRSNLGWTASTAVHRYQEITRCSNSYSPTHYHHSSPNIKVTALPLLSFLPSWETGLHLPWPSKGFWEPVSFQLHPWSGSMYRGLATHTRSSLSSSRQTHSIVAIQ